MQSILVPQSSGSSILWFFIVLIDPEDGSSMILWNIKNYTTNNTTCSHHCQCDQFFLNNSEDGHCKLFHNIGDCILVFMASYPKGLESPATLLWEPPTSHHEKLFRLFEECSPVPWNCIILRGLTILLQRPSKKPTSKITFQMSVQKTNNTGCIFTKSYILTKSKK